MSVPVIVMTKETAIEVGELIRELRSPKSQDEIAEGAGFTVRWLSDVEKGSKLRPSKAKLEALSIAVDLPKDGLSRFIKGESLAEIRAGVFPPATTAGHGGSEGWSEFLEEKYDHAIRLSEEAKDDVQAVMKEVRAIRKDLARLVRASQ